MSETVLVIGAGGFIGRHLVQQLAEEDIPVTAISRRSAGIAHAQVRWHAEEAPSVDAWRDHLSDVCTVVYLASVSTPAGSAGRPVAEAGGLTHLLTFLEALQAFPAVHLIYVSSAGSLYPPANGVPSTESDPIAPRSYHGASKSAAEAFIGSWCAQFEGSATIIRPSNVYGPGQVTQRGFAVIPNAFWHMRHARTMDVWGNGSQTRDYIYVDDVVELCAAAIRQRRAGMAIYNAASGRSTSLNDLFAVIEDVAGLALSRAYHEPRAVDAIHIAIDATKARTHFDWTAQTDLRKGMEETWRWYRSIEA